MSTPFDAADIERRYAFLDDCPEHLLPLVVTLPIGRLPERVAGVRAWRDALLLGRLPPTDVWPPAEVAGPARQALDSMGLVRFCKGQEDLVDALLNDILASFGRQADVVRSDVAAKLRELEELERKRREEREAAAQRAHREAQARRSRGGGGQSAPNGPASGDRAEGGSDESGHAGGAKPAGLDAQTRERLQAEAEREVAAMARDADADIVATWSERARAWADIADVFGDLGLIMGRGFDMALGVLRHTGWMEILKLRKLVEQLPQLREIVQSLGRLHASDNDTSVAESILVPVRRLEEERLEIRTPLVPAETRGVERSGEIARMLPVEAVNLGHPKLRMLWHARRAERALLSYRVEGIEIERTLVERDAFEEAEGRRPRPERGPIIAVLDTSGSMHGTPELVAKALVLECLRTAHEEKRRCFLYAYSGPGQVVEHELDLSPEGVGRLLAFLGFTFGGGNDETGVMMRVVERLKANGWTKADVVFVSDGEWPAPVALVSVVKEAREGGVRFHGVQIGNRGQTGLHQVCDPVHVFQDWARAGGW